MANCKDCIHYEPCFEYGNILDPIHGGVKCNSFKPAADVVSKSEVDRLEQAYNARLAKDIETNADFVKYAKREVAREIFEDLKKFCRPPMPECQPLCIIRESEMEELKSKYLGGTHEQTD